MLESEELGLILGLTSQLTGPTLGQPFLGLLSDGILDSAICRATTASGQWAFLTWSLFAALVNPVLVLPLLLALIGLPWLVRAIPYKRQISGFGLLLLLLYGLTCSAPGIQLGSRVLVGLLPADPGRSADVIVVLGRGPDLRLERVQVAAQLWHSKRAPVVFASGTGDAQPIGELLVQSGVMPEAVTGEPCSRTTEENAQFTAALLKPQGIQTILLVTDPPHMLRSWLTFRSFGFEVIPHPNPLPAQLTPHKEAFLLVREYVGLASYGVLGRFLPRDVPPLSAVS